MDKVAVGFGLAGSTLACTDKIVTQVASVVCLSVAVGLVVALHRLHRRVSDLEQP
jgi:hypothetical protein